MAETTLITAFFWSALVLLFLVTGGVGYLTLMEWRDRQERSKKS